VVCVLDILSEVYRGLPALVTKYYSANQIKKNEMGEVCSMYGGRERFIQDFGGET
jgi:hypothetical protein